MAQGVRLGTPSMGCDVRFGSILLKKSATSSERAIFESERMSS
jgi:hypothetical protein